MRKLHAFTLVELLVVIGIIALLISILLPSLARARQSAINLQCQSNLRSVGQGLLFYANDHKGKLPYSGSGGWELLWPAQVTMLLGSPMTPTGDQWLNVNGNYAPVLRCPDVSPDYLSGAWNGGTHYTAIARAMPWWDTNDGLKGKRLGAYPMATKDASSKMLMWDGPILPAFGNNAPTCNVNQCDWFLTWGGPAPGQTVTWTNWFADPDMGFDENRVVPPATDMSFNSTIKTSPQWVGLVNRDGGAADFPWDMRQVGLQRYRHMGDTSGNFLYLALKCLKDIEHQVNFEAEALGLERQHDVTGGGDRLRQVGEAFL